MRRKKKTVKGEIRSAIYHYAVDLSKYFIARAKGESKEAREKARYNAVRAKNHLQDKVEEAEGTIIRAAWSMQDIMDDCAYNAEAVQLLASRTMDELNQLIHKDQKQ